MYEVLATSSFLASVPQKYNVLHA